VADIGQKIGADVAGEEDACDDGDGLKPRQPKLVEE
jgi:hypothetical protein